MDAKCKTVTAYSVSHFAVDFACAFLVLRYFGNRADTAMLCLIYNFFAFAMQLPMGIMADKLNKNSLVALCGCVFGIWCGRIGSHFPWGEARVVV